MSENYRIPVTVERARKMADELDLGDDVTKALTEAEALGYQIVDWEIDYGVDGTSTLAIGRHDGVMISLTVPPNIGEAYAVPGGDALFDFHITVVYLGMLADFSVEQQQQLIGIVTEVARDWKILEGTLAGLGIFEGDEEDTVYVGAQITGIHEIRAALIRRLDDAGIPYKDEFEFFQPHMTIGQISKDLSDEARAILLNTAVTPSSIRFLKLTAAIGGAHYDAQFFSDGMFYGDGDVGVNSTADGWMDGAHSAYRPNMFKALAVRKDDQFTLGAWYVPDFIDAHGDWIDKADVEKAFHDYVKTGDRFIRLQHNRDIIAGEWVEAYVQRDRLEVNVPDPDSGELVKHVYPAGTPFLGVKWNDWAWNLVKAGEIRGYSIGGTAESFEIDLGPDAIDAAKVAS